MNIVEKLKNLRKEIQNSPEDVMNEVEKLLKQLKLSDDHQNLIEGYILLSDVFSHQGKYKQAKEALAPAFSIATETNDKKMQAKLHNNFGTIYWYQGQYLKAMEEYLQTKKLAEELGDKRMLHTAYNNLGIISWINDDYEGAIKNYNKGLELLDDKDSYNAANSMNNIGLCYLRLDDVGKALEYLTPALDVFIKENDIKFIANSYLNIANCYLMTDEKEKALANIEMALVMKRKIKDQWGICNCLNLVIARYLALDRIAEAKAAIDEAMPLTKELEANDLLRTLYELASNYYEIVGDYKKALEYFRKFSDLEHEIFMGESQKQISQLEKDFELKEKEKENEIYRLKNIELKKKNDLISKQKTQLDKALQSLKELNDNLQNELEKQLQEMRKKDQMLSLQSKQASMGEMLACIAHQWKQPLNCISLITQNLTDTWEYDEFNEDFLFINCEKILEMVNFMSVTINDFRDFFRPELESENFNLKDMVTKTLRFVEHSMKQSNVNVELKLDDVNVDGFPNYYSQVVMNILNNARDALEERKISDPTIKIKTYTSANTHKSVLTIEDNAGGIPQDVLERIFEPYFTTKTKEKGTGLGLYMSKTIIEENMHGFLTASNHGDGACFRIEL